MDGRTEAKQVYKKVNQKVKLGCLDVREDKYITNKVRVVSLAHEPGTTPNRLPRHHFFRGRIVFLFL